ncbi:MerR family transcriptional regulator [Lachnospiraceae bacterium 46-15]
MRISEAASRTGLNVSNIRFYERKGLLTPARAEESTYRDYTEEDVHRIKQILLYRKMGISVETIYLLLNGQADREDILRRQGLELHEQMKNLQGAADLCQMVLQDGEIAEGKLDEYLNYVHEEEEKGIRFAVVEELLETITEYTRTDVFYGYPGIVWLFQKPWIARILSVGIWMALIAVPLLHIINVFQGKEPLKIVMLTVYAVILAVYGTGFLSFWRARKRYRCEEERKE